MRKSALITGIAGQDGSYLAELLLEKGYEVHGIVHENDPAGLNHISHLEPLIDSGTNLFVHYADLQNRDSLQQVIEASDPDELYNLGGQTHVGKSFEIAEYTADVVALGAMRLLESLRKHKPQCRYFQAGSSELFGKVEQVPQTLKTPFNPRSPYATSKLFAYNTVVNYRDAYGMFAVNGIMYNHESPRRDPAFVTRKITRAAARIALGLQKKLTLGSLDVERDWGYAPEYVSAMWMMLQRDVPDNYILATGKPHSLERFLETAFAHVDLDWHEYVEQDPRFMRPTEVNKLIGDPSYVKETLGWQPIVSFERLVELMVDADLELAKNESQQESAE